MLWTLTGLYVVVNIRITKVRIFYKQVPISISIYEFRIDHNLPLPLLSLSLPFKTKDG